MSSYGLADASIITEVRDIAGAMTERVGGALQELEQESGR